MVSYRVVYGWKNIVVQVSLYEVLREDAMWPSAAESAGDSDGLRLIDRRRIRTRRPGWEVFKLRHVIQQWVNDPSSNRGDHFITSLPAPVWVRSIAITVSV